MSYYEAMMSVKDDELTQEELDKLIDDLYGNGQDRNPTTGSPE